MTAGEATGRAGEVARVVGLFVGGPRTMVGTSIAPSPDTSPPDDGGSATSAVWVSAIAKAACTAPVLLGAINLAGDDQADRRFHGGPDKAVCVYAAAHYPSWWADDGWPSRLGPDTFGYGAFGENITVSAPMTEADVCIGDVLRLGGATVQVSQPRQPCWKLGRRWGFPDLTTRTRQTGRTGWYLRVLETGVVAPDETLVLLERPHPAWSIGEANRVMVHDRHDLAAAEALAACPALAAEWAVPLRNRVERGR